MVLYLISPTHLGLMVPKTSSRCRHPSGVDRGLEQELEGFKVHRHPVTFTPRVRVIVSGSKRVRCETYQSTVKCEKDEHPCPQPHTRVIGGLKQQKDP